MLAVLCGVGVSGVLAVVLCEGGVAFELFLSVVAVAVVFRRGSGHVSLLVQAWL
jgi:hypothetical protein